MSLDCDGELNSGNKLGLLLGSHALDAFKRYIAPRSLPFRGNASECPTGGWLIIVMQNADSSEKYNKNSALLRSSAVIAISLFKHVHKLKIPLSIS